MPGQGSSQGWYGYYDVATNRIILTNGMWIVEVWRNAKGLVNVPVFRRPKVLGARREYSVYVRDIRSRKESYLDGGIAKEFISLIQRPVEIVVMAGGDVIVFNELFPEFIKLNEFIISRLRFE